MLLDDTKNYIDQVEIIRKKEVITVLDLGLGLHSHQENTKHNWKNFSFALMTPASFEAY